MEGWKRIQLLVGAGLFSGAKILSFGEGILGCPPVQDASHHKDYMNHFLHRGSQPKPSFAMIESWEGLYQPKVKKKNSTVIQK